jgi:hypothetical protein
LYNGTIAYEAWDGPDWEIRFWDGAQIIEITDNDYNDTQPSLSGDRLAWVGRPDALDQIFYAKNLFDVERDPTIRSVHGGGAPEERADAGGPAAGADEGAWLGAPRPTPFRMQTSLAFAVPDERRVRLAVYDVAGRRVRSLVDGSCASGRHTADWNGRSDDGAALVPGVYFVRLETGESAATRKVVLLD